MTDKYKLLEEIRQGPNNVRPGKLLKVMTDFGFDNRRTKHQVLYRHSKYRDVTASVVEHREGKQEGKILQCYVRNCLKAIDAVVAREAEDEKRKK